MRRLCAQTQVSSRFRLLRAVCVARRGTTGRRRRHATRPGIERRFRLRARLDTAAGGERGRVRQRHPHNPTPREWSHIGPFVSPAVSDGSSGHRRRRPASNSIHYFLQDRLGPAGAAAVRRLPSTKLREPRRPGAGAARLRPASRPRSPSCHCTRRPGQRTPPTAGLSTTGQTTRPEQRTTAQVRSASASPRPRDTETAAFGDRRRRRGMEAERRAKSRQRETAPVSRPTRRRRGTKSSGCHRRERLAHPSVCLPARPGWR